MIVLCGMTSTGKDTIQKELINLGVESVVSYTTRPPRPGEVDGVSYHFVTQDEFLLKEQEGFFAETTSYNVAVNGGETWYYGAAIDDLSCDKVIIMNPDGLKVIKRISDVNPVVFHIIADEETIWNRLRSRGDNSEEARRRLNADEEDFKSINKYVDFSIRNDGSKTPKEIAEIIMYLYNYKPSNKEKKTKLFIDLDEVTFNTTKCITDLYNADFCYYSDYKPIHWTDVNTWNFTELEAATAEQLNTYFNQPRFFANVEFMDNAYEVICGLKDEYDITFVSHGYSPNLRLKKVFVEQTFPFADFIGVNLKEHKDKSCVDMSGGIFIDDAVNNLRTSNAEYKICFGDDHPWNEGWDGARCYNWFEVREILKIINESRG